MNEIARRYAAACLDLPIDPERFIQTAEAVLASPLYPVLKDPTVDRLEKERILNRIPFLQQDQKIRNFYQILAKKGRVGLLAEIAESFRMQELARRNIAVCKMRCVHQPDQAHQERLIRLLCALHHHDGVLLRIETDPSLLGGFILELDGYTYDQSVRGQLRNMMGLLPQERRMR